MIKATSALNTITKVGSIILATLVSFIVDPPVIDIGNPPIFYSRVVIFFAGVVGLVIFKKFKSRFRIGIAISFLLAGLIGLISIYEFLYHNNSIDCPWSSDRIVISNHEFRPEVKENYLTWEQDFANQDPLSHFLAAYRCNPLSLWQFEDLALPYYSFILVYFSMVVIICFILFFVSEMLNEKIYPLTKNTQK